VRAARTIHLLNRCTGIQLPPRLPGQEKQRSGMRYEQMGRRGPLCFLAAAVSGQSHQWQQGLGKRSAAYEQSSEYCLEDGSQHFTAKQHLSGSPVSPIQDQARRPRLRKLSFEVETTFFMPANVLPDLPGRGHLFQKASSRAKPDCQPAFSILLDSS
jgi:hypothetical protein